MAANLRGVATLASGKPARYEVSWKTGSRTPSVRSARYWEKNRTVFVSNDTGNWFPLRTRASAEIVHITLQCS